VIDALLMGDKVAVTGGTVDLAGTPSTLPDAEVQGMAGGEVANMLAEAQAYRSSVVNTSKSQLTRYEAKLGQFRANPLVMVQREWTDAVGTFMGRDSVQVMLLPPNSQLATLLLNRDPDAMRAAEIARKQREQMDTDRQRMEQLRREQFQTETGLQVAPS
jgi:hypothetical protein